MRQFDVVGDEIMGEIMGYDEEGNMVVGAAPAPRAAAPAHRVMKIAPKPQWRAQLAPGVIQPDEGMVPLTLLGQAGSPPGTFSATIPSITFQGQLQKPYRAERLLVSTVRTGTSAVGRLITTPFVGTDLQMADINGFDAELVGQPGSFGTRLTLKAAEPGVLIRLVTNLSVVLAGTDTIQANFTFLGRIIH